jgi:hypothetical protein
MTTLTVTARGQVTLRKDALQHLGTKPGGKMELDLLPGGRGGQAVNGTSDTHKLVSDDPVQSKAAAKVLTNRVRGSKKYALDDPLLGLGTSPVGKRASVGFAKMDLRIYNGR